MKNDPRDDEPAENAPSNDKDLEAVEALMGPEPKKPNLADAKYTDDDSPEKPDKKAAPADHKDEAKAEDPGKVIEPNQEESIELDDDGGGDSEGEAADEPKVPPTTEDPVVDKAIDDIVAKEGDDVLAAEDAKLAEAFSNEKPSAKQRFKLFMAAWWNNKWARYGTILGLILLIVGLFLWPTSRYAILNTAGVRASTSITVTDEKSGQPLKKVSVSIDDLTAKTGDDGAITFNNLKLGPHNQVIEKPGFATVKKTVVLGWGSNPQPNYELTATGSRFTFELVDFLTGKPIKAAKSDEVTTKENNATINDKGVAELTIEPTESSEIEATVNVKGYRTEKVSVKVTNKEPIKVKMVPAKPVVFMSKRSGKYDLYRVDADGKNEKLLVKGTGTEQVPSLALQVSPDGTKAALVSTRDNTTNSDGYVMSGLYVVDLSNGDLKKVEVSERIQLVDWSGNRLVYVKVAQGASGTNPKRHRLVTYDVENESNKELAASNYFNDVLVADGRIYYAPSNSFQENPNAYVFRINPDGGNKQVVLDKEAWNILRVDEKTLNISVQQDWYTFDVTKDTTAKKISKPAATPVNHFFVPSPSGNSKVLWVDNRDGKGVLLLNTDDKKDKVLVTKSGLKYPVAWINEDTVVFRVSTPQETADYVVSLNGGEPQKIKDVSDTPGIGLWYYY